MPQAFEAEQIGKRQSLANIIANIQSEATPYTSMVQKRERPKQVLHSWQVKSYPTTGHRGVIDGEDAADFTSNPRKLIQMNGQKTWYKAGVSDFADEAEIAGLSKGEMAEQVADALVAVNFQIEGRCLSSYDCTDDDGTTHGNETRGAFSYISNTAQTLYPIHEDFRTPSASVYTGAFASVTESAFGDLMGSSYDERKGPFTMHGFVGRELKKAMTDWTVRDATGSATTFPVRTFNQEAKSKELIRTIDRLVMDTGTVHLHLSSYLLTNQDTGAATTYSKKSGIFVDLNMVGLAYTRLPRVVKLPYRGGGQKAFVDAIFLHMMDNVRGMAAVAPTS
jgi:hypothetical protein